MNFERGKDVKEALDLGVKKEAIKITGIAYVLNEQEHEIRNSRKMEVFIKRFCNGDLPNDSLFGIESIHFYCIEERIVEEYDMDSLRGLHRGPSSFGPDLMPKKYRIAESKQTYSLKEMLGKAVNIYDTLLLIPAEDELKKIGFSYLLELGKCEEIMGRDYIEIRNKIQKLEDAERENESKRMDLEMEEMKKDLEEDKNALGIEPPKKEKKRKRFWQ